MKKIILALLAAAIMSTYGAVSISAQEDFSSVPDDSSSSSDSQVDTDTKKDLNECTVTLSEYTFTSDGTPKMPEIMVTDGDRILMKNSDYTVSYIKNVSPGTAFAIVTGMGDYTGIVAKTFTIKSSITSISKAVVTIVKSVYEYGGEIKPLPTVRLNGILLKNNVDYTVSYEKNNIVGSAKIIVTGKGKYNGCVKKSFTINPAKQEIQKLESEYKGFYIDYVMKGSATGYQIQYSTASSFTSSVTVKISDNKTDKKNISNLLGGKKYYVRVRSLTYTDGRTYYGAWSTIRTVTTESINKYPADTAIKSYTSKTDSVTLTWNKASNANGYRIYQKKDGIWKTVKVITSADTTSYTVSGLSAGKDYAFTIRAYKIYDDVQYLSKTYTAKNTATCCAKVKITSTAASDTTVKLQWDKVTGTGYRIYQKVSGEWQMITEIADSSTTSYTVKGLTKGKTYDFCMRAYKKDSSGGYNAGALCYATVKTKTFSAPENIKKIINTGSVGLSWSDSDKSGNYEVYRLDGSKWVMIGQTSELTFIDINLSPATSYTYKIKEIRGKESLQTSQFTVKTADIPDKATSTQGRDLWVGDSRTVHLSRYQNIQTVAMSGKGYNYLMDHINEICSYKNCNIILNFGVNDLRYLDNYIDAYNSIYERTKDTCKVYFMTINPCNGDYSYRIDTINDFNSKMKQKLNSGITVIDTNDFLQKTGFVSPDGLHYDMNTYTKIYTYTMTAVHKKAPY